ncbi:MAG: hypothetical protein HQM10_18450 [Candidatus Riflebacteria bacterium]|nr:hypothetical protein [Candidatus Riflebacteria bacterium]
MIISIEKRIEAIERENRILRRSLLIFVIAFSAIFLQGLLPEKSARGKTIEAEKFVLKSNSGKTRGVWEAKDSSTIFSMFDENGIQRLSFGVSNTDESITLNDANGNPRIKVSFAEGDSAIILLDGNKKIRTGIYLNAQGPCFDFKDANGRRRIGMLITDDGPGFSLLHSNGKCGLGFVIAKDIPSMVFTDPWGKILWAAPSVQMPEN